MISFSKIFRRTLCGNFVICSLLAVGCAPSPQPAPTTQKTDVSSIFDRGSIKPYPICFFDPYPPKRIDRARATEGLVKVMKRFDPNALATADDCWVIAKTTKSQHAQLLKLWPRVACIGTVTSGTEVKRSADCANYIYRFLRSGDYTKFDIKKDSVHSDEAPGPEHVICCRGADSP